VGVTFISSFFILKLVVQIVLLTHRESRGLSKQFTLEFFPKDLRHLCTLGHCNYFTQLTCLTLLDSLLLDPKDVDPNVHPTKREVHFLNEEAIIECVSDHLQSALVKQSSSRSFETQVSW
jgi:DNA mismatch repair protein, C-terminal domain